MLRPISLFSGVLAGGLLYRAAFSTSAIRSDTGNRVFFRIRYSQEFDQLKTLPTPLLCNFYIRNDPFSKTVSERLKEIVERETTNTVNAVDIEADEPEVREFMIDYGVNQIPTIIALRGGIVIDKYVPKKDTDLGDLKGWVDKIGGGDAPKKE